MKNLNIQLIILFELFQFAVLQTGSQLDAGMMHQGGVIQLQPQQLSMNVNGMSPGIIHSHISGPSIQSVPLSSGGQWTMFERSQMNVPIQSAGGLEVGLGAGAAGSSGASAAQGIQHNSVLVNSQGAALSSQSGISALGGTQSAHGLQLQGSGLTQGMQGTGMAQTLHGAGMTQNLHGIGISQGLQGNSMSQGVQAAGMSHGIQGNGLSPGIQGNGLSPGIQGTGMAQGLQGSALQGSGMAQGVVMGGMPAQDINHVQSHGVFVYPGGQAGANHFQGFQYQGAMVGGAAAGLGGLGAGGGIAGVEGQHALNMVATTAKPATTTTAAPGKPTPFPKIKFVDAANFKTGNINWKDVAGAMLQMGKLLNWVAGFSLMQ